MYLIPRSNYSSTGHVIIYRRFNVNICWKKRLIILNGNLINGKLAHTDVFNKAKKSPANTTLETVKPEHQICFIPTFSFPDSIVYNLGRQSERNPFDIFCCVYFWEWNYEIDLNSTLLLFTHFHIHASYFIHKVVGNMLGLQMKL